ncbi:hypothetical protein SNE40_008361 [Patella caerulea]|uniref:Farnesoic acid O-methyl transferase domain-containing protein n=1 Tax=Patella caerulea TaxID=87958 RepID=A0AAN8Q3L8_PATCE
MEKFLVGIVALLFLKVCFSLQVFTPDDEDNAFPLARKGFTVTNITQLRFKLKACDGGHLILQKDEVVDFNTYGSWTFVIGSFTNTRSSIRSAVYGTLYSIHYEAVLDCNEFRPFWIRWKGGLLELGKGSEFGISRISSLNTGTPFLGFNHAFVLTGWGSYGCWDIDTGSAMLASTWKTFPGSKKILGTKVLSYQNRSLVECSLKCLTSEDLPCGCVEYSYNMVTKQCLVVDASSDVTIVDEARWETWNLL